jgi:hypothetical protein
MNVKINSKGSEVLDKFNIKEFGKSNSDYIMYIDTKRNHKKSYFEKLQKLWQYKYRDWRIDLIIVCYNEAYDFICAR